MISSFVHRFVGYGYRSVWLVGMAFLLLIALGLLWRSFYLHALETQFKYVQLTESLFIKSNLIENLIISARNRSILLAQMLFQQHEQAKSDVLLLQFHEEANRIIASRQAYEALADDHESRLLKEHFEISYKNRLQQDYLLDLLAQGEGELAVQEYVDQTLPLQQQALAILDNLHTHVEDQRAMRMQQIGSDFQSTVRIVSYSTVIYLVFLFLLAALIVWRLIKNAQQQFELQDQLSDRLLETTQTCEQIDKELIHLAQFDVLTNLYNRRYFEYQLSECLTHFSQLSLMVLDVDNFKWFNDTQGHAAGDQLLTVFAQHLKSDTSPLAHAIMGRIGGDEFALVLTHQQYPSEEEVAAFLSSVMSQLDEYFEPAKPLNISMGLARYPQDAKEAHSLMRFADLALHKAKTQAKGGLVVFDAGLLKAIYDELDSEQALKQALQKRELVVFYQGQYRLADLTLSGAEALVRWRRYSQWVSPANFIPLAEKTGLIHELGLQVLEKVLQDMHSWDDGLTSMPKVAINVSPVQMILESAHSKLLATIDASGIDRQRIEIEITESAFADGEVCVNFVEQLEHRHIAIALDDFGTGYSSLSQITKLRIDKLKIDQSFVAQLEHSEEVRLLIQTIIQMGHSLGLTLLAEGIETLTQYQLLKEWGCDEGQGYLFARPVPADQFVFTSPSIY